MQTDYGFAFRVFRAARDWSQGDVAKRLKVGRSMLSLIESGKRQPSAATIDGAARSFGVPPSLFVALASRKVDDVTAPLMFALVRRKNGR